MCWLLDDFGFLPEMDVVREHDVIVFTVLAREHNILAVDFTGEKSHALVLNCLAVEGYNFKVNKILCFNQLRQDFKAIIGRIGSIIGNHTFIIKKLYEAGIFNATAFVFRNGKDNSLGYAVLRSKIHFII